MTVTTTATLESGARYIATWSGTATHAAFLDPGYCRLTGDVGSGSVLLDGGVAFGNRGDSSGGAPLYNTIRSTFTFTATAGSGTFSPACFVRRAGGDESPASLDSLSIELIKIG